MSKRSRRDDPPTILSDWEMRIECPHCDEQIDCRALGCGIGRAVESAAERLTRHAAEYGCDLRCGQVMLTVRSTTGN